MINGIEAFSSRYGLHADPKGAHVTMLYGGRHLLGEVSSVYRDEITGAFRLRVIFFNGDPWPVEPVLSAVGILQRFGTPIKD